MIISKCSHSHYYDSERYDSCPHCAKMTNVGYSQDEPVTVALMNMQEESPTTSFGAQAQDEPVTMAFEAQPQVQEESLAMEFGAQVQAQEEPVTMAFGVRQQEEPVTMALNMKKESIQSAIEAQKVENYAEQYLKRNFQGVYTSGEVNENAEKNRGSRYTVGWLVCIRGEEYGRDFRLYTGFNRIGRMHNNDIVLKDVQIAGDEHCSIIYEEKKNLFYVFPNTGNTIYVEGKPVTQIQEIKNGEVITVGETDLELIVFCSGERRWEKNGQS